MVIITLRILLNAFLLFFADSTFHNKRTLLEDALQAIRDLEEVKESLEDVSNDENQHFEADETNFDAGKRKHDDNEVDDTAQGEKEELLVNDSPIRGQKGQKRYCDFDDYWDKVLICGFVPWWT